ncbi:MAG TPA: chromate efflux transporter [Bacteroidia bacterium]|jgi:chromate transporter|nr:chromate efflux transporter [Bacteroidia bacterium]
MNKEYLKETGLLFLKLGATTFGGPAATIAIMEKEVVQKRNWLNRQDFLDLVGAASILPGPSSTQMAIFCGYSRAGALGLWLAGFCYILPAFIITTTLAWFYIQYGSTPAIAPFFDGIKPAVVAIILDAIILFGKKTLKNWQLGLIGIAVCAGALYGLNQIMLILAAGFIGMIWFSGFSKNVKTIFPFVLLQTPAMLASYSTAKLFWVFLKIGSVLFGGGYILFAYLDHDLVQNLHWLNHQQLMDAIAAGQFTPGPILSTATFIGYQIGGFSGAIVATIGIFLPSFFFVWALTPIIPKLRKSAAASAFLDSVNIAAVALMLTVTIHMGMSTFLNWQSILIGVLAFAVILLFNKVNSFWIILGGALMGFAFHLFQ